jgi:osmotically-inducible protein OsmY
VSDEEIAKRAVSILARDTRVPKDALQVRFHDRWIMLTGDVNWYHQKDAAENALHRLHGLKDIYNEVAIRSPDKLSDIKARIDSALTCLTDVEAERIQVAVTGRTVVLEASGELVGRAAGRGERGLGDASRHARDVPVGTWRSSHSACSGLHWNWPAATSSCCGGPSWPTM